MSTRTNIVLTIGSTTVYLYRHSDGYPAETGADILLKLRAAYGTTECHYSADGAADRFLRAIFAEYYEQQSYEKTPKAVYELTTEIHGDIKHVYRITFDGEPAIHHAERPHNWHQDAPVDGFAVERWVNKTLRYSLEHFAQVVNRERREMNTRLAEIKRKNPGSAYDSYGDYEMVSV